MAPPITDVERQTIISLRESGYRVVDICRVVGVTKRTVYFWLRRYDEEGSTERHKRERFARATTSDQDQAIVDAHSADPFLSTRVTATEYSVSLDTVRRRLTAAGLRHHRTGIKPSLKEHQRKHKITVAKKKVWKTSNDDDSPCDDMPLSERLKCQSSFACDSSLTEESSDDLNLQLWKEKSQQFGDLLKPDEVLPSDERDELKFFEERSELH